MVPRPSATIATSTPCMTCGQDLRGLARDGHCPECSAPVVRSVEPLGPPGSDPAWRRITVGLACLAGSFVVPELGWLLAAELRQLTYWGVLPAEVALWAHRVGAGSAGVLMIGGVLLVTARTRTALDRTRSRRWVRIVMPVGVVLSLSSTFGAINTLAFRSEIAALSLWWLTPATGAAGYALLAFWLHAVLRRADAREAATLALVGMGAVGAGSALSAVAITGYIVEFAGGRGLNQLIGIAETIDALMPWALAGTGLALGVVAMRVRRRLHGGPAPATTGEIGDGRRRLAVGAWLLAAAVILPLGAALAPRVQDDPRPFSPPWNLRMIAAPIALGLGGWLITTTLTPSDRGSIARWTARTGLVAAAVLAFGAGALVATGRAEGVTGSSVHELLAVPALAALVVGWWALAGRTHHLATTLGARRLALVIAMLLVTGAVLNLAAIGMRTFGADVGRLPPQSVFTLGVLSTDFWGLVRWPTAGALVWFGVRVWGRGASDLP